VSDLPKGWALAQVADILSIRNGFAFKRTSFSEKGVPLIRQSELKGKLIDISSAVFLPIEFLEMYSEYIVSKGDLLIGMSGSLGKISAYTFEFPALQNQRTGLLKVDSQTASKEFALYALQYLEPEIILQGKGVAVQNVSASQIESCRFPLPPREEQIRIVEKLEELLSDLDAGVAELKAAQKKLVHYRQSLLKAAVEGALTAEWRKSHQPEETGAQLLERILKERRARWEAKQLAKFQEQGKTPPKDWQDKYLEPIKPDTSNLPELPEGWLWSSIGQTFQVVVGATPSRKEPKYWNGEIPWVSSGEVRFNRISKTNERISIEGLNNSSTQINPIGSVLLGMIGEGKTRGQVAILKIEAANNQNCAAIWVSETDIPPEYIYYWLWSRYEETRRGSSGNNQPALNKSIVEKIPFPMPPIDELKIIVQFVNASVLEIEKQEVAISYSLKQSAAQRKNILKAAFSGKLVPQDPNDEPASMLLERIRNERMTQISKGSTRTRKLNNA